jgi:4-amino-4-deoxy-L-arabinose transferase-like glycosyltransferase
MKPRPILVVFIVALLVRLAVVMFLLPQLRPNQNPDYYRELGRNVALGKGFVAIAPDGRELPNINRPPGYPVFLAGLMRFFGDRLGVLLVANCVLAAAGCALTVVLASRWLPWGGAVIAGLLTAFDPNSVLRCGLVMTEMLFTLLLVAGACVLAWRREEGYAWLLCGILWGLATLCRAITMYLPFVAVLMLFLWRARWQHFFLFLFLVGFVPLIGLWAVRNEHLTGQYFFSSSGKNVLVTGWATEMEQKRTGAPMETVRKRILDRTGTLEFFDTRQQFEKTRQEQAKLLHETVSAAPMRLVVEMLRGTAETLLGPGAHSLETVSFQPVAGRRWWHVPYSGLLLLFLILAVCGAIRHGRNVALPTILVLYFVALSIQPIGNSRFRYPIIPLLAILAVAAYTKTKQNPSDATESLHHRN